MGDVISISPELPDTVSEDGKSPSCVRAGAAEEPIGTDDGAKPPCAAKGGIGGCRLGESDTRAPSLDLDGIQSALVEGFDEALNKIEIHHEDARVKYFSSRRSTLTTSPCSMNRGT